ncbi:MAG: flagellar M-ring protein FliF C-terminal domain-containing protein, partial [Candidatus Gastranaerophilaceae bacterium]
TKVYKTPIVLLTTDNIGKALEIQALLAKQGITAERVADGNKSNLTLSEYTMSQRDRALLAIVQSGLVDQNIGLEVFDKGDFTSTKDDKRIRLARAINGELSRLIRKIPPIENASVFVSIPDPSLFTANQKPATATVQVSIPTGDRLTNDKIRAITNLLIGSVQGLNASDISITDTNGNVYSSIIDPQDDIRSITEENDQYMKNKIEAQLDKLVGKSKYVVTVSTFLRQSPAEKTSLIYDPKNKSVTSAQRFTEGLGDKSSDKGTASGAVSSYLPSGVSGQTSNSSQNRAYSRSAEELEFGVSKTQVSESLRAGMVEDISIAVTVENGSLPSSMTMEELKNLVAKTASPKVSANNVEIAFSDSVNPYLAAEHPIKTLTPEGSGNPWWTVVVLLASGLIVGFIFIANKVKNEARKQETEIRNLREQSMVQENKLNEMNQKSALLLAKQEQMQQSISTTKQTVPIAANLQETIGQLTENVDMVDNVPLHLKHWIENAT